MSVSRFEEPVRQSPGFVLWRITAGWERALTAALKPLDLTHPQFVLLACIYWANTHGQTPSQADIAQQAGLDPKAVSPVLRRLEKARLLTRGIDPADSRARAVTVTDQGAAVAAKAIALVEHVDEEYFSQLPAAFRTALLECAGPA